MYYVLLPASSLNPVTTAATTASTRKITGIIFKICKGRTNEKTT
jgi:hypothetical protein